MINSRLNLSFIKNNFPSILSLLRILAAPIFFYLFVNNFFGGAIIIFILAGFTDFLDGFLARKLDVDSRIGAYLDVLADFILIIICFGAMVFQGWYPLLLLPLLGAVFALFLLSSPFKELIYDPLGKYWGGFLMLIILLSLLFPLPLLREYFLISILIFTVLSAVSRIIFFLHPKRI